MRIIGVLLIMFIVVSCTNDNEDVGNSTYPPPRVIEEKLNVEILDSYEGVGGETIYSLCISHLLEDSLIINWKEIEFIYNWNTRVDRNAIDACECDLIKLYDLLKHDGFVVKSENEGCRVLGGRGYFEPSCQLVIKPNFSDVRVVDCAVPKLELVSSFSEYSLKLSSSTDKIKLYYFSFTGDAIYSSNWISF